MREIVSFLFLWNEFRTKYAAATNLIGAPFINYFISRKSFLHKNWEMF
jgi:hypothetical protein